MKLILQLLMAFMCAVAAGGSAFAQDEALKPGEHTAQINGVKLWYKVSGTGPVCLMPSPPWGLSSDVYINTLQPMEKIFTMVYLDSRGCGRSAPAPSPTQYTWADLDADLDGLRAHLGQEKVWVMGHSEGAMAALHYACKHPERTNGAVLMSVGGIAGKELGPDEDARLAERAGDPRFAEALKVTREAKEMPTTEPALSKFLHAQLSLYWYDPSKMAKYHFSGGSKTSPAAAMQGKEASHRGDLSDITADYKNLTAPVLIVVGANDWICPLDISTRLHMALRNSKLLVIEQCGHFTWMEQPEVFNARVPEFLAALGLDSK